MAKRNSKNQFLTDLLIPGEDWELVEQGYQFTEGTAVNAKGELYYQDIPASKTCKVGLDRKLATLNIDAKRAAVLVLAPILIVILPPVGEIEKLLKSPIHEVRVGGVSIMDKESRTKKITEGRLNEFYALFMRRHDRINDWDLVDLGCLHMTGSYLFTKPRDILYKLARSKNIWERRTAILSTCYFIRQGELNDRFKIAELLVNDDEDLIHKATGSMLRFASDKDQRKLIAFLDKYGATMPRTLLRYAIEKLTKRQREHYLGLKKSQ